MNEKIVAWGELLLRLSPPGSQRMAQAHSFDFYSGGAEANALVTLAQLGISTQMVSRVPAHALGTICVQQLRAHGVEVQHVQRGGEKLGLYFMESGGSQRPPLVIYDRQHSALSQIDPAKLDWEKILTDATWFYFTGITPALSPTATQATLEGAQAAKRLGLKVGCDLNYRAKLWDRATARKTLEQLMPFVDVCLGLDPLLDFEREADEAKNQRKLEQALQSLTEKYGFTAMALNMRQEHSASRHGWRGLYWTQGQAYWSTAYDIDVVERIGTGDAYAAGILYGLMQQKSPQETVEFAAAAGCLKHSVPGDFHLISLEEVENLCQGHSHGRIQR